MVTAMTEAEFVEFRKAYFSAFPSTWEWLCRTWHDDVEKIEATLARWRQTLASTSLADALDVIQRIVDGRLQPVANYERDNTAIVIRAYAGRLADDRRRQRERDARHYEYTAFAPDTRYVPCTRLLERLERLTADALDEFPEEREVPAGKRRSVTAYVADRMDWEGLR